MALNSRQKLLYRYTVDIWRRTPPIVSSGVASDFARYGLLTASVPCLFESLREVGGPTAVGRSKEVVVFTLDKFHFDPSIDVKDTDYVRLATAPGANPLVGRWWAVQGNPRVHTSLAGSNKQVIDAKLAEKPAGAP